MIDKITDIPDVPQEIIDAVNKSKLAVFIGAGVSRLVGCLGWNELATKLIEKCYEKGVLNDKDKQFVLQLSDNSKKITIAFNQLKNENESELFYNCMEEALMFGKNETKLKKDNIYDKIIKLGGTFITTNADVLFDNKFIPGNIYFKEDDFIPENVPKDKINKLFHIHGSIKDRDSLVFTLPQYLTRYSNEGFKKFLEDIFLEFTVLFLGYGLTEFKLLGFFFKGKSNSLKHYMLEPFFVGEDNLLKLSQLYYDELGVVVIGYAKDKKGYHQLEDILNKWEYDINKASLYVHNSFKKIANALNNFNIDKTLTATAIQLIKNDKGQFTYFLDEIEKSPDIINWLKPLKDTDFFNPNDNPKPIELADRPGSFKMSNWRILNYLEYAAFENSKKQESEIDDVIIEIIDEIIKSEIMNPSTNRKILKILTLLPVKKITQTHIRFVEKSLEFELDKAGIEHEISERFAPYLIKHRAKILILELIKVLLAYKEKKSENYIMYITSLDNYYFRRIIGRFKKEIADICGLEALNIGIQKIEEFLKIDNRQFMKSKFESLDLDDTTSEREHSAQLIFFARTMLEELAPSLIRNKIENFLKANDLIFRRLAINAINHHYQELSDLFWNINENLLNEYDIKLELYELLKAKAVKFDNDQVSKVLSWIENADYHLPGNDEIDKEEKKKILAYMKKEWITAFDKSKHPQVIKRFNEYDGINPVDVRHPGHSFWIETGFVNSPKSGEEILGMDNKKIAEFLKEFEPSSNDIISPKAEGLSTNLRQSVTDSPEKFADNLLPFLEVPHIYINSIIYGFYEACKRNNEFDWNKVIEFIQGFIQNKSIPVEIQTLGGIDYKKGIYSAILNLLEEGLREKNYAIDEQLMPNVEDILFAIADICESEKLFNPDDMISSLINSQKGKLYIAFLEYSIRYAILNKDSKQRWKNSIKQYFTEILNSPEDISWEFYVSAGSYLNPIYYYLDKEWITQNINKIFPKEHEEFWLYAMQGYLTYFNLIYDDIYNLLKVEGHYSKAIDMDDCDKEIVRGVVQHICVGLHNNWERLDDEESLISVLLNKEKANYLKEIVWYYRSFIKKRKTLPEIKPLWRKIFKICENHIDKKDFKEVVGDIWEWVKLVEVVDEEVVEFLKLSCQHIEAFYQGGKFVEFLSNFVVKEPQKAGELFLAMDDNNVIPQYKSEDVRKTITSLLENGEEKIKKIGEKICNIYAMNGLGGIVSDIMDEYFPDK